METALYRIVQESLTNVAKHSQAHKVSILLREEADAVDATITDDGRGFDVEEIQKMGDQDRGLGLVGMQERALLLDGTATVESGHDHGTVVKVHIPIHVAPFSEKNTPAELVV